MGDSTEDFLDNCLYDLPATKRFNVAEVERYTQIKIGDFDDWGSNVSGIYCCKVVNTKTRKHIANVYYEIKLHDRYDKNDEQPYDSFEDASIVKITKIEYIKEAK